MPAHIVRAILISVGIIAALGLAVYENPEVQAWLDEQRRKLAALLRNIGDELDPQSRREAEAFAYGATPQPREPAESSTTGAETVTDTTVRRVPVQGSVSDAEREERQRLGEEYLARRSQQMIEMRERASRTRSFDTMVDEEGKLKDVKQEDIKQEETEPEEVERCETPRPVVPPKIKLEDADPMPMEEVSSMPGALPVEALATSITSSTDLTFEEQLAIALMASAEPTPEDYDLREAIRQSLENAEIPDIAAPSSEPDTEDLYYATPNLTRASLAALDVQHPALVPEPSGQRTPTEASSFAFDTDSTMSEAVEVTDAASEVSTDGVRTPDSWSEIGSHDATEMHAA